MIINNLSKSNIFSILQNEFGFIENSEFLEDLNGPFVIIFSHCSSLVVISTYTKLR